MMQLFLPACLLFLQFTASAAFVTPGWGARQATTRSASPSTTQLMAAAYQKIFVAGGSKGVGRQIVHQILAQNDGTGVVALVRDPEVAKDLNSLSTETAPITAIVGDAMDQKTVENAMDGCDAAISTLGGSTADRRIDYTGNSNVIESAGILGVTRIVLVTTIGCGSSRVATPDSTYEVLKELIEAKNRAENLLIKYYTNSNWTIIRPGGLKSEPMTGQAVLTADPTLLGLIHREDVARLVLAALTSPKTERQILSALDPTIESSYAWDKPVEPFALE